MKLKIRIAYGMCSYGVAIALLLIPYFSSPDTHAAARIISFLGGAFLAASSLVTDFELGLARLLRFRESAFVTFIGSLCVIMIALLLSYDGLQWVVLALALVQLVMGGLALKTHYTNRQHLV